MRALLALCAIALVTACVDTTPRCSPDAEVTGCICPNGRLGTHRCSSDGLEFGACVCPPEDAGADAASDASASTDASVDGAGG